MPHRIALSCQAVRRGYMVNNYDEPVTGLTDIGAFEFLGSAAATISGTYRLSARHSGKALDVANASTANGANVMQWTADLTTTLPTSNGSLPPPPMASTPS